VNRTSDKPGGWRRGLALAGIAALVGGVALVEGRASVGPVPFDAVIVLVPLALVALVPALRSIGVAGLRTGGILVPLLVFLAFMLGSVAGNGFGPDAFATFVRYTSYGLLLVAVASLAADRAFRRTALWLITASGVAVSAVGLVWYAERVSAFRSVAANAGLAVPAVRVFSTFQNANFLGEYLVLVIAASLALAFLSRGWRRYAALGALMPVALALVLTYTRGSWLAIAVALTLALIAIEARYVVAFLAAGAAGVLAIPGFAARLATSFSTEGTGGFRLRLWRVAGEAIAARPLAGWGPGRFYEAFAATVDANPELGVGYSQYGAHNGYFTLATETGVPGALAFVVLVLALVRSGVRVIASATEHALRFEAAALTAGVGAFALNALTSNAYQHPQPALFFWLTAALLVGVSLEAANTADAAADAASVRVRWRDSSIVAAALAPGAAALRRAWDGSAVRAFALRAPRDRDGILAGSLALRLLLGRGRAEARR
jgi:putative inorganic carbon (HCO3(-)) transporter